MKMLVLTTLLFSSAVHAEMQTHAQSIENDMNGYFSETINEGDSSAHVLRIKKIPQIRCGQPISKDEKRLVFCTVDVETKFQSGDEDRKGQTSCSSLGFYLNSKNEVIGHYDEDRFQECLEKVYDASYE